MNKLAVGLVALSIVSCGSVPDGTEKTEGAFSYQPYALNSYDVRAKNEHMMTNFNCSPGLNPPSNFNIGVRMSVHPWTAPPGSQYASATYGVEFYADTVETLSIAMSTLPMVEVVDGAGYHYLTNPWSTGAGMWLSPATQGYPVSGNWFKYPTEVPTWGLVIYAAGERPDYPTGVAVLLLDPSTNPINTTSNRFQGRCDYRRQFVFPL